MEKIQIRDVVLVIAAVVVFASGVYLSHFGRPYSGALVTLHKLVALLAVVIVGTMVYRVHQAMGLPMPDLALTLAALLTAVAAFVSGGIVSSNNLAPQSIIWLHRISSFAAVFLTAITALRMAGRG